MPPATSKPTHPLLDTPIHNAHDPAVPVPLLLIYSSLSVLYPYDQYLVWCFPLQVATFEGPLLAPPSTFVIRCSAFATSISNGFVRREVSACTSSHIRFAQQSTLNSTAFAYVRILLQHATVFLPPRSMHKSVSQPYQTYHTATHYIHANIPHTYKLHILNSLLRIPFKVSNLSIYF
jgi:hypothetical protein